MKQLARQHRKNRAAVAEARQHLEQSRADRPAVEALSADLRREAEVNGFTSRVRSSLRGRPL